MPLSDFNAVVKRKYTIRPVRSDLIPSNHGTKQQILWVGCSDSLILETETLGVQPDEIFVHRNLGNIISNGDLSSASALEWCIEHLKVEHIVICGHYDCALLHPTDNVGRRWYNDITKVHNVNGIYMSTSAGMVGLDEVTREHRLEEIYVLAEVDWLKRQPNVEKAMRERRLQVHAFCYNKETNQCSEMVERDGGADVTSKVPWTQTLQQLATTPVSMG